ncbi:wall-associated receptor kinase 2-like [Durio zibethinus]|uniref:Wall-associated receptor kinase 2-like n=1 Tax=Durio zibethinus TaxID=66656 RepID=A0A6P6AM54_DURZI|nr:wall-associated receptor kinase 2-like [Durio zibethinus]
MGLHGICKEFSMIAMMLTVILTSVAALAKPGCQSHCGNISIPYPFGTGKGCNISENFFIRCNTTFNPPKAFLDTDNVEVLDIALDGQLRIQNWVRYDCYGPKGSLSYLEGGLIFAKFTLSRTRNKLTAVGCDTYVFIEGYLESGQRYSTGCVSFCNKTTDVTNGSCSGTGCCLQDIPERATSYGLSFQSYTNHADILSFNPCSYAFVVEDGAYTFTIPDLYGYNMRYKEFPLILDWTIGNQTCKEAKKELENYVCKENSACIDPENGSGYLCKCLDGFQGNPYLSNGCQDINECETMRPCNTTCHNLVGSYNCYCPEGYEGDGWKNGTGCSPKVTGGQNFPVLNVALGIGISVPAFFLCSSCLYLVLRQRKLTKLKQKYFRQNGGFLLWEQLSKREDCGETAKIFTAEELKKATNNYHESRILGQGGQGTVYKGILPDGRNVAIKKSIIGNESQVHQFINEVIVLTQINHRNVVKLLGCCLETQVPLLVYEYIRNGTLFDHMHKAAHHAPTIPWETRLKIATGTSEALSYLHSAASPPIIHRDVKLTNILLDDNYNAKVSDFGCSRLIPSDKAQITTLVQGTLGYLDPEYLHTSQLTEKSDVYSFGVVLIELITGLKVLSFERPEAERNLAMFFVSVMKEERLVDILDGRVVNDENIEQLKEVAILARRCVRVKGEERPTMKEVASELEGLCATEKRKSGKDYLREEEEHEHLLYGLYNHRPRYDGSSINSIGYDSINNPDNFEIYGGR